MEITCAVFNLIWVFEFLILITIDFAWLSFCRFLLIKVSSIFLFHSAACWCSLCLSIWPEI